MTSQPSEDQAAKVLRHEQQMQKAKLHLFFKYALTDQRNYYDKNVEKHNEALKGVNVLRASAALATIAVTALATFFVQTRFDANSNCVIDANGLSCDTIKVIVNTLLVLSVTFPALGAFFNMLTDLYQWKRLVKFYKEASNALEKADAATPTDEDAPAEYRAGVMLTASGTLNVMRDEAGQWGQLIRPNEELERYVAASRKYYEDLAKKLNPKALAENVPVVDQPKPDAGQADNGVSPNP